MVWPTKQKVIACDLDRTLAHYDKWRKDGSIGDPIPGVLNRVIQALKLGHAVYIFTARLDPTTHKAEDLIDQEARIAAWTFEHVGVRLPATATKLAIFDEFWDDKGMRVEANEGTHSDESGDLWTQCAGPVL